VSSWGDTEDERRRRLEERAMRNYREAMTGGGGSSSGRASLNIPFWFFGAAFAAGQIIDRAAS
jgi:hypothetical protein